MPIAQPQSVSTAAQARPAIETVHLAVRTSSSSSSIDENESETNLLARDVHSEIINCKSDEDEQKGGRTTTVTEIDNSAAIQQPKLNAVSKNNAASSPTGRRSSNNGRRFCAALTFQKDAKRQQKLLLAQQAHANATTRNITETQVDQWAHLRTLRDVHAADDPRQRIMDDIQRFRYRCGTFVNRPSVQFFIVGYV
jgi:hypothetical protein